MELVFVGADGWGTFGRTAIVFFSGGSSPLSKAQTISSSEGHFILSSHDGPVNRKSQEQVPSSRHFPFPPQSFGHFISFLSEQNLPTSGHSISDPFKVVDFCPDTQVAVRFPEVIMSSPLFVQVEVKHAAVRSLLSLVIIKHLEFIPNVSKGEVADDCMLAEMHSLFSITSLTKQPSEKEDAEHLDFPR